MRRTILLLAFVALAVLLAAGVAWAATNDCVTGEDFCVGTDEPDTINGSEEKDKICGLDGDDRLLENGGNDRVYGGNDRDTIEGGSGNDTLDDNPDTDTVRGGKGEGNLDRGGDLDKLCGEGNAYNLTDSSYRGGADDPNALYGGNGNDRTCLATPSSTVALATTP